MSSGTRRARLAKSGTGRARKQRNTCATPSARPTASGATARTETSDALQRAEQRGFEAGRERGVADGLAQVFRELGSPRGATARSLVPVVVDAAAALFAEQIAVQPERIESVIREMLARVPRAQKVHIEVHPGNAAFAQAIAADIGATVECRPELGQADCVVRTNGGTVDGRLHVRLPVLRQALEKIGVNWSQDPPDC